jgi:hypothetical protein
VGRRRRVGRGLALAGLALVAAATLTPASDPRHMELSTPLWCLVCGDEGGADVAANLLLFLPLAIGLRLSGWSWRRTVATAAALSFTVELLQLTVIPGRDASLSDVLTNTTSAAIGATLAPYLPRVLSPASAMARVLLAGGAVAWLAALSISAWLLAPGLPAGRIPSRWAHEVRAPDAFDGRVRSVHLDGVAMPHRGPPPGWAALRHRLERGTLSLDAEVLSGNPVRNRSWMYQLGAGPRGALTLFQDGREAGLVVPARGLRFGLRPVALTLPEGMPSAAGVPVRLQGTVRGRHLRLSSSYDGVERSVELGVSPAMGWMLLTPFNPPAGTALHWITGMCLAGALLPLGYWASRTGRAATAVGLLAAALAAGLAALPAVAGFPPVHWSEWLAGGAGAAAGWALRPVAAYLERRCALPSDSESSSS